MIQYWEWESDGCFQGFFLGWGKRLSEGVVKYHRIFEENKAIFGGNQGILKKIKKFLEENQAIFEENKTIFEENKEIFAEC